MYFSKAFFVIFSIKKNESELGSDFNDFCERMRLKWHWSNLYKIDIIITSLTEMLELPNFGHMTTFTL